MSDQSMGMALLLATVLLWMVGGFLQLRIIKKLERLTDEMWRTSAPRGRPARRGRLRREAAVSQATEDRLSVGSQQR